MAMAIMHEPDRMAAHQKTMNSAATTLKIESNLQSDALALRIDSSRNFRFKATGSGARIRIIPPKPKASFGDFLTNCLQLSINLDSSTVVYVVMEQ